MGCGLSKSTDSDSPKHKRRRGSKGKNSVGASPVGSAEDVTKVELTVDGKKNNKLRSNVTPTPVLNQTKVLSSSQLEFFRQLDQKIEQGEDLDERKAEQERQARMTLLQQHWDEVVHSRPGTTRLTRPPSLAAGAGGGGGGARLANGSVCRSSSLDADEGPQPARQERNLRSSRRSMRSARADSVDMEGGAPPAAGGQTASAAAAPADGTQLVTKLIQLGDAYVHDLDAGDPDSFLRLGRRSSNYEEPAIMEEAEAAHAARAGAGAAHYGRSSLALRTMLDDKVH